MRPHRFLVLIFIILMSCKPSSEALLQKAEIEENNQKSKLAKYLYLQVLKKNQDLNTKRFKALEGLARIAIDQLHDYREGIQFAEKLISEFSQVSSKKDKVVAWRLRAAQIWSKNLDRPDKAIRLLELIPFGNLNENIEKTMGHIYLSLREFDNAEKYFLSSWKKAELYGNCKLLEPLQLQLIQTYALKKNCEKSIEWAHKELPKDCSPDKFSALLEEAHCLEIMGQVDNAIALYEKMIQKRPENDRAKFLLQGIKQRKKNKAAK
jgi:tetratricopeptide (TPR) repeat protein